ncbi:PREDICTED: protein PIN-LIKES 7 isoform X2 [Tarenaya hassleriana]|uniref:protein PIN-LIKES 7 isoform X2 n=1 Tax=Tarenaya hassleriana TaxID=28532 RepID=UPI00053C383D|nr:PREDICTED: protein PIN-LIKES 7 isoform X2 [Tarenaya hassleriana]
MGFLALLEVASMPIVQVLLISVLGAFLATDYCSLLSAETRRSLNKVTQLEKKWRIYLFLDVSGMHVTWSKLLNILFAACLRGIHALPHVRQPGQDRHFTGHHFMVRTERWLNTVRKRKEGIRTHVIIKLSAVRWFMPLNVGITFLVGGVLGWLVVKVLKPKPQLHGLIIATCASGNMGNLMLILVPAICDEEGSPFGSRSVCRSIGLSYASFSMALGGFYIWTYSYQLVRSSAVQFKALASSVKSQNKDIDSDHHTHLLKTDIETQTQHDQPSEKKKASAWTNIKDLLHQILEELFAPPTIGAILGFAFGATKWLRNLIIGETAPFRVVQDSVQLLGDGTIPCITLILGGNLIQGLRSSAVKTSVLVGVICVRYIILPIIGIGVVQLAGNFGFLPEDPLFKYVLMLQFTLPPAMNISTMAQLFDVAQDECSVIFLWTYLVASLALTVWSTIFLSILS